MTDALDALAAQIATNVNTERSAKTLIEWFASILSAAKGAKFVQSAPLILGLVHYLHVIEE